MPKFNDLTSMKFGRLTVVSRTDNRNDRAAFNCSCDCGNSVVVRSSKLINGHTKSCGCLRDKGREALRPTYSSWVSMIRRCKDESSPRYERYGGRGIKVCEQWLSSFEQFLSDMGKRPAGHTLDRKDNDGDYEPGNCRWASNRQQARNKSSTREITFNGETRCMADWATHLGMPRTTLQQRIYRGWSIKRALTEPANSKGAKS